MLILVGVSVSIALNSGLFKAAQGGAKNTEAERINETQLSTGMITVINSTTNQPEEVDINSFGKTEEVYTHKLSFTYGEETFECYLKEDTTFEQLDALYDEVAVDAVGFASILGLYRCDVFYCFGSDDGCDCTCCKGGWGNEYYGLRGSDRVVETIRNHSEACYEGVMHGARSWWWCTAQHERDCAAEYEERCRVAAYCNIASL